MRELDDEHGEARFVVGEIERLVDEGAARAEIAVLYRTNAMSRVIEDTLVRREIAYQVIGGTKFYERAEIKDAIAYLSLAGQPVRRGRASRASSTLPAAVWGARRCRGSSRTPPPWACPCGRRRPPPSRSRAWARPR